MTSREKFTNDIMDKVQAALFLPPEKLYVLRVNEMIRENNLVSRLTAKGFLFGGRYYTDYTQSGITIKEVNKLPLLHVDMLPVMQKFLLSWRDYKAEKALLLNAINGMATACVANEDFYSLLPDALRRIIGFGEIKNTTGVCSSAKELKALEDRFEPYMSLVTKRMTKNLILKI
jgi:hypothetical protein